MGTAICKGLTSCRCGVLQVRPVPEAMELVKWQFGALTSEAELDYITAKMRELCSVPDAGTAVGGAGAPALDPVAPSAPVYDEYLASPSDHCGLCEKQPIHWTCTACDSSAGSQTLPTELRPFVAVRSLADTVAVSNNIGLDLNWTNVPLRPSPDDMRLMTDVINTAHSFVKRTEGDRCVAYIVSNAMYAASCVTAFPIQLCEPAGPPACIQGPSLLLESPAETGCAKLDQTGGPNGEIQADASVRSLE